MLQQGGHFRTQLQMRRKRGDAIWVDMSGTLLSTESSESSESLWMTIDISQMKRQQELLERMAS